MQIKIQISLKNSYMVDPTDKEPNISRFLILKTISEIRMELKNVSS
jgi:hypothetical protein